MANSDADLPSEATISTKLRDVVIATHKSGNVEELTLKRVRARAEQELGLDAGFFKQDPEWKQKSDVIIKDAFVRLHLHAAVKHVLTQTRITTAVTTNLRQNLRQSQPLQSRNRNRNRSPKQTMQKHKV